MKSICILLLLLSSSFNLFCQETASSTFIYFDVDDYTLADLSKGQLAELYADLEQHSDYSIEIIGHTDQDGSEAYNSLLAKNRAMTVRDYLISLGYPIDRISQNWKGETELVTLGNSDIAKQKNRRVELKTTTWDFESTEDVTAQLTEHLESQIFICDSKPQFFDLAQGSSVYVPADAFEYENGKAVDGAIVIEIKEAFLYTDIIANNLYTDSKGEILETGGMMYIAATSDGQPLQLKEGKRIELIYPLQSEEDGMELFYGEESEGGITWNETGEDISTTQVKNDPLEIDLQQIMEYDFGEIVKPKLQFAQLPARPRRAKKPFPPSAQIYSGEKYEEMYNNYLSRLEDNNNDLPRYEKKESKWQLEVMERISAIENYKRDIAEFQYKIKLVSAVRGLEQMENLRAPAELLTKIFSFLNKPYMVRMDHRKIYKKAFGNYTREIVEEKNLEVMQEEHMAFVRAGFYSDLKALIFDARRQAAEKNFLKTGKIAQSDFSSYVVGISQLGWINCDRFRNFEDTSTLTIAKADGDTKYYMIFKELRSILRPKVLATTAEFRAVPVGEAVKLVAVKLFNEKPYLATLDHEIGLNDEVVFDFKPCSLNQIREELNSLDPSYKPAKNVPVDLSISLFPNPATTSFSVQADRQELLTGLAMYDMNGSLVKAINDSDQFSDRVSVSDVAAGMYVVNAVYSDGRVASERVVIER